MSANGSREDMFEAYIKENNLEGKDISRVLREYAKCTMPLSTICALQKYSYRQAAEHAHRAVGGKSYLVGTAKRHKEIHYEKET